MFVPDGHPRRGGLSRCSMVPTPNAKAMVELPPDVDAVEAKREDWTRLIVYLIEEGGNIYRRWTSGHEGAGGDLGGQRDSVS